MRARKARLCNNKESRVEDIGYSWALPKAFHLKPVTTEQILLKVILFPMLRKQVSDIIYYDSISQNRFLILQYAFSL